MGLKVGVGAAKGGLTMSSAGVVKALRAMGTEGKSWRELAHSCTGVLQQGPCTFFVGCNFKQLGGLQVDGPNPDMLQETLAWPYKLSVLDGGY